MRCCLGSQPDTAQGPSAGLAGAARRQCRCCCTHGCWAPATRCLQSCSRHAASALRCLLSAAVCCCACRALLLPHPLAPQAAAAATVVPLPPLLPGRTEQLRRQPASPDAVLKSAQCLGKLGFAAGKRALDRATGRGLRAWLLPRSATTNTTDCLHSVQVPPIASLAAAFWARSPQTWQTRLGAAFRSGILQQTLQEAPGAQRWTT